MVALADFNAVLGAHRRFDARQLSKCVVGLRVLFHESADMISPAVRDRPGAAADGADWIDWLAGSDGSLFETHAPSHPEGPPEDELWRLPLDGAPPEPLGITGTGIFYASVTRDRKRIAYSTQTFGQELWLLKPCSPPTCTLQSVP